MREVLWAGAEKVSINTAAVLNPELINKGAAAFGSQCIVLGMDVKRTEKSTQIPSGYEVVIYGGRTPTGIDALKWAKEAESRGAGEICLNSIDADGTQEGYELEITRLIATQVGLPVIASGGAGTPEHIYEVFTQAQADAALIASLVHYDLYPIPKIKEFLSKMGIRVRVLW
jgi:cyclase